jgi:hypothetical protein
MALFDVSSLIEQLQSLEADQNPFDYIAASIAASIDQGWCTGMTVTLSICSAVSCVSVVTNGASLVQRVRAGDISLIRKQPSRLGVFYIPQLTAFWSVLQVLIFVLLQFNIWALVFEGYTNAQLRFTFVFRHLFSVAAMLNSFLHLINTVRTHAWSTVAH